MARRVRPIGLAVRTPRRVAALAALGLITLSVAGLAGRFALLAGGRLVRLAGLARLLARLARLRLGALRAGRIPPGPGRLVLRAGRIGARLPVRSLAGLAILRLHAALRGLAARVAGRVVRAGRIGARRIVVAL